MRNKILIGLATLTMIACKQEGKDYVTFSGKITNKNSDKVMIFNRESGYKKIIKVAEDGTFKDTLRVKTGFYDFNDGREYAQIYLESGSDIKMSLDAKQFDETIKFEGKGSEGSNFLTEKMLKKEQVLGNLRALYSADEKVFLDKVNAYKNDLEKSLKKVGGDFAKKEQKNLDYDYISMVNTYERAHRALTKNKDFKVSESFPNPLKDLDLRNEEDFKEYPDYQSLVINDFFAKADKESSDDKPFHKVAIEKLKALKSGNIRNGLLSAMASMIKDTNQAKDKEVYDAVMSLSTDDKLKERINKELERNKALLKGNPSPIFENYENYKGGTTSLSDFKGKYVYVDVWATWCGPCKAEIPFMKKVEEKYHGKNIAFVSVSVDKQNKKADWKKMIEDKKMAGVQLIADKDWSSSFVQKYGIRGIPRFILIDPQGNIVNANAPRPSSNELIKLFDSLGL